ncbi:MAG: hypothetical protein D6711_10945 [Chloroflexi bacterium]|nr:MAG: hypothetical protein D6711_10945 [Chloroflexota bacterium]
MSIILNREGGVSVFRVGVLAAVIGILAIIGGYVYFQLENDRRSKPLEVELYPNAELWSQVYDLPTSREVYYISRDASPEDVVMYYQALLDDFYDQNATDPRREHQCRRFPESGIFPDYVEGSGNLPYFYSCLFEDAFFDAEHSTVIEIQPGIANDAEGFDNTGLTFIRYIQRWTG